MGWLKKTAKKVAKSVKKTVIAPINDNVVKPVIDVHKKALDAVVVDPIRQGVEIGAGVVQQAAGMVVPQEPIQQHAQVVQAPQQMAPQQLAQVVEAPKDEAILDEESGKESAKRKAKSAGKRNLTVSRSSGRGLNV